MNTTSAPRFDVAVLRELAGERGFARGEACHLNGQVVLLSIEAERVLAQVAGTMNYRTELVGHGEEIGGACSCPAFADRGFCKHMVAVALAANAAGGDAATDGAGTMDRIRDYLRGKSTDALVSMMLELATRDPVLLGRLDLAAAAKLGNAEALQARLRKAIDAATRTRGFVDYGAATGWAEGIGVVLDAVADLVPAGRGRIAAELALHTIDRIEKAVENVDDSDGHCTVLLEQARDIHLTAVRSAPPDPVQLARNLYDREMQQEFGTFGSAAALYADVLGEAGLEEYRRRAAEAWDKLPPRRGATRRQDWPLGEYGPLRDILDFFAERDGDVDARIALRTKNLSSPWDYLQLAEFCLSHGRGDEALRRAEEGLWIFEDDRPDERLVFLAARLLLNAGRDGDAEKHLWRAFQRAPGFELYLRLRAIGGEAAHDRALDALEARLAAPGQDRWLGRADLLVRILMHAEQYDAAWAALRRHGGSMSLKEELARASETTHPREVLETYADHIDQLADAGGNPAYAVAAELVARMATLQGAAEQTAYLATLKARWGRKRNFMRLLG